jgi:hypothetical protein
VITRELVGQAFPVFLGYILRQKFATLAQPNSSAKKAIKVSLLFIGCFSGSQRRAFILALLESIARANSPDRQIEIPLGNETSAISTDVCPVDSALGFFLTILELCLSRYSERDIPFLETILPLVCSENSNIQHLAVRCLAAFDWVSVKLALTLAIAFVQLPSDAIMRVVGAEPQADSLLSCCL